MEEYKPDVTDSEGDELTPAEGTEDVSKADDLEAPSDEDYYQKLTGREDVKSKEDFEKHYDGMKRLVGDQTIAEMRKKAEAYEKISKTQKGEAVKGASQDPVEGRVDRLEDELKVERFLKQFPEAQPILGSIRAKAKLNDLTFEEAYSKPLGDEKFSMQELITSKLEAEKAKDEEQSIGVKSKPRIAQGDQAEINQLTKQVQETDSIKAKENLVEKALRLSE